jgi:hypothetical protein
MLELLAGGKGGLNSIPSNSDIVITRVKTASTEHGKK